MKFINSFLISLCVFFIGFAIFFSFIPNITLSDIVLLGCFVIPSIIIFITMIIQVKTTTKEIEKKQIKNFWLKALFVVYCLLLVEVLFLKNEFRSGISIQNIFSGTNIRSINLIPFSTIISYIHRLSDNSINTSIVIMNLFTNLILFAPMGFFIPILFNKKIKNIKQFIFFVMVTTIFIESIQFFTISGSADIDDVILNTFGACLVYLLMNTKTAKKFLSI